MGTHEAHVNHPSENLEILETSSAKERINQLPRELKEKTEATVCIHSRDLQNIQRWLWWRHPFLANHYDITHGIHSDDSNTEYVQLTFFNRQTRSRKKQEFKAEQELEKLRVLSPDRTEIKANSVTNIIQKIKEKIGLLPLLGSGGMKNVYSSPLNEKEVVLRAKELSITPFSDLDRQQLLTLPQEIHDLEAALDAKHARLPELEKEIDNLEKRVDQVKTPEVLENLRAEFLNKRKEYEELKQIKDDLVSKIKEYRELTERSEKHVKDINPKQLGLKKLQDEMLVLAHLNNVPGIPKITGIGNAFGIETKIDGHDLDYHLDKPHKLGWWIDTFIEICRTLHACHKKGIIHRDLKPKNIVIDRHTEQPIVVDFGLAKTPWSDPNEEDGLVMGTPTYISPEGAHAQFNNIKEHSDIYSLGVTFYHLLAGQEPFTGHNTFEILMKHLEKAPLPLVSQDNFLSDYQNDSGETITFSPELRKSLSLAIMATLEKNPSDRPASMRSLAQDLWRIKQHFAAEMNLIVPPTRVDVSANSFAAESFVDSSVAEISSPSSIPSISHPLETTNPDELKELLLELFMSTQKNFSYSEGHRFIDFLTNNQKIWENLKKHQKQPAILKNLLLGYYLEEYKRTPEDGDSSSHAA